LSGNGTIDSSGTGALAFTSPGAIVQAGTVNRTLNVSGSNTGDNTFVPALVDGTGSLLSVNKAGSGKWILTGNNTYTGITNVNSGTLQLGLTAQSPVLPGPNGANIAKGRIVLDYTGGSAPGGTVKSLLTTAYASNFATGQI